MTDAAAPQNLRWQRELTRIGWSGADVAALQANWPTRANRATFDMLADTVTALYDLARYHRADPATPEQACAWLRTLYTVDGHRVVPAARVVARLGDRRASPGWVMRIAWVYWLAGNRDFDLGRAAFVLGFGNADLAAACKNGPVSVQALRVLAGLTGPADTGEHDGPRP